MINRIFWTRLSLLTITLIVMIFALEQLIFPELAAHRAFSLTCIILFVMICAALYWAAQSAIKSSNKFAFTNLVSVSVFGKMVFAIAFLLAWQKMMKPADQGFVGIFLLSYVVYTVYEVWFMTKLARGK